jgi:NADH:ubiquinone reductase (non-electrogenic)
MKEMLTEVDNGLRALPATAQVAKQEGEHLVGRCRLTL